MFGIKKNKIKNADFSPPALDTVSQVLLHIRAAVELSM